MISKIILLSDFETIVLGISNFNTIIKGVYILEEDKNYLPNNHVDYVVYMDHSHNYLIQLSQCYEVARARIIT